MSTQYKLFGNLGCHTILPSLEKRENYYANSSDISCKSDTTLSPVETKENYFVNYAIRGGGQNNCEQNANIVTDPATALKNLRTYFEQTLGKHGSVILVGKKETLATNNINNHFDQIKNYYNETPEYYYLPENIKMYVDVLNNLRIKAPLKKNGVPVLHVVGWESFAGQQALMKNGYGVGPPAVIGQEWRGFTLKVFGIGDVIND